MFSDQLPGAARADLAACRALLRGGSRTFFAASLLLPAKVRDPAAALYGFCRLADDAVDRGDENGDGHAADTIARLRDRLERAYAGRPLPLAADRAFAATVSQFDIPRALPEALIEGFAWDIAGRRYETLHDLLGYAARVAGSVGAMMTLVMGVDSPRVVARACDLGIAMQLSNIARDVGEDARSGRLYLPLEWLRAAGIDPDSWLAEPVFTPKLGAVIGRLLSEADRFYRQSEAGIGSLPAPCRPGIRAARFLYAEIGREVERRNCNSVSSRAVVAPFRKLRVLVRGLVPAAGRGAAAPFEAQSARFLIDAVADRESMVGTIPDFAATRVPWWNLGEGIAWAIQLFERLEKADRLKADRARTAAYLAQARSARPHHDGQPVAQI
jgi:phytoene synthase